MKLINKNQNKNKQLEQNETILPAEPALQADIPLYLDRLAFPIEDYFQGLDHCEF